MKILYNSNLLFTILFSTMCYSFSFEIIKFMSIIYDNFITMKIDKNKTNNNKSTILQSNYILIIRRVWLRIAYEIQKQSSNKWIEMKNNNKSKHNTINIL